MQTYMQVYKGKKTSLYNSNHLESQYVVGPPLFFITV